MTTPPRVAEGAGPSSGPPGGPPAGPGRADDLAADLSLLMGRLVRLLRREVPSVVGPGSLSALATLSRCGPLRLGDLAAREGVAPPTLTRMVAALEEAGYVVRRPDPGDRRAVQVFLTEAGADLVVGALRARADVLRRRLETLPDDARQGLAAAVPALRDLVEDGPGA